MSPGALSRRDLLALAAVSAASPRSLRAQLERTLAEDAPDDLAPLRSLGRIGIAGGPLGRAELQRALRLEDDPLVLAIDGGGPPTASPEGDVVIGPDGRGADDAAQAERLAPVESNRIDSSRANSNGARAPAAIALAGGDPVRWAAALHPRQRRSRVSAALWRAHRAGTHLIGAGRDAEALSAAAIVERAELNAWHRRGRNPRERGRPVMFWALGYFPWALVAVERPDLSLARWLGVAWRERMRFAVWLPTDAALLGDAERDRFRSVGPGRALALDLRPARRSRQWLFGARLSELPAGATWDGAQRRVSGGEPIGLGTAARVQRVADALAPAALSAALAELAAGGPAEPARSLALEDGARTLVLRLDDDVRRIPAEPGTAGALAHVRLDLTAARDELS